MDTPDCYDMDEKPAVLSFGELFDPTSIEIPKMKPIIKI